MRRPIPFELASPRSIEQRFAEMPPRLEAPGTALAARWDVRRRGIDGGFGAVTAAGDSFFLLTSRRPMPSARFRQARPDRVRTDTDYSTCQGP